MSDTLASNKVKKICYNTGASDPGTAGCYKQAVRAGNLIFTAGQTSKDPATGKVIHYGDIRAQTHRIFQNIEGLLKEQGDSLNDIVKRTIMLKNINDLEAVYDVMSEYFRDPEYYPACSCFVAHELANRDYMVEIEVIAVVPDN
ncbi:MAG TPA: RidA family protein [Hyphomicrobiales bacterium]|nr:RidA family protein [Hyphomicrobiales bacterium]